MAKSLEDAAKDLFDHMTKDGKISWLSAVTFDSTKIIVGIRSKPAVDIPAVWWGHPVHIEGGLEIQERLAPSPNEEHEKSAD